MRLTVCDDGVGVAAGFDPRAGRSMGLQLVCMLAEQLDATLAVRSEGGAIFELVFARSS